VATASALLAWMLWSMNAERRSIARMPAEQRRVIYDHAIEGLRALCREPVDPTMRRRCREQAEFLAAFPECDAACEELIDPLLRRPVR
jgi:hypothetical protein